VADAIRMIMEGAGWARLMARGLAVMLAAPVWLALCATSASAATTGTITEFAVPTESSLPAGIAAGPDGSMWFTEAVGNKIGRITTAGAITEFAIPTADSHPVGIAAGPDGSMWFTEFKGNKIGRITTAGAITEFAIPEFAGPNESSLPVEIAAGPDGNMWFTEALGNKIGRITTGGAITEFAVPTESSVPLGIVAGPDGNVWFTEHIGNNIGRITTGGAITEFAVPTETSLPLEIAAGPDGNMWFTEALGNKIGRITVVPVADLSIALMGSPNPVVSGNQLIYTLTATNGGGETASEVKLEDQLPDSAVLKSLHTTQGACTRTTTTKPETKGGLMSCNLGSLEGGKSATITIAVTATKPGIVNAKAVVTASNVTSDTDDEAPATTTVLGD